MKQLKVKVRAVIRQEVKNAIGETELKKQIVDSSKRISKLETAIVQQESSLHQGIGARISGLEQDMGAQFSGLEQALNKKMQVLSDHIDSLTQQTKEMKTAVVAVSKKTQPSPQERVAALRRALDKDDETQVLQIVKALAQEKKRASQQFVDCANQMRDLLVEKGGHKAHDEALRTLFNLHTADEFRREDYLDVNHLKIPVMQAASLRQQFVRRRRMKQIGNVPDRWLVYNKFAGEEFAQQVGLKIPYSEHGFTLDTLPRKTDIVVKPLSSASSIGVYIVHSETGIFSVEHVKRLQSWEEMIGCLRADIVSGRIQTDAFEVQEAIYSDSKEKTPVHDLKFYSFYGEIPAILEIVRLPEKAYWWWTPEGELIDIGKTMPEHMKPVGFTPDMLKTARELSLKIPAPYMRLDFLRGDDEIYFDEFCTMSGGENAIVLEQHFPKWDRVFGNCYLKAEMRIMNDLLEGKQFNEINTFNQICEKRYRK